MAVQINEDHMIPVRSGHAVGRGWLTPTDRQPKGVTWHWTAGWTLESCRKTLGGATPTRKGQASAHYGIGRSAAEGIDRYVSLENRSWHAGVNQVLRWDGKPSTQKTKGSRATIGIETVHIGFARQGILPEADWQPAISPNGRHDMRVQPWPEAQIEMMIQVGREIIGRWPHIEARDHHGHHDVCPGYKEDVAGFPFARVLRGIYRDPTIPDVWGPLWQAVTRQRALIALGYDLGDSGPAGDGADGQWGRVSDAALLAFQMDRGQVQNGFWTTFTCWALHDALTARGTTIDAAVAPA